MGIFQVLVRNLEGKTLCLRFSSREVSCEDVKARLAASEGVPGDLQRLVAGTREFSSGRKLVAGADGFFPYCTLLLRLRGGKGGFGSLLRGAATKAGQKKTSNFDACRDMSGRRLRHVNAEKKLKEWKADAKERELEKTAEDYLKKRKRNEVEDSGIGKDIEGYTNASLLAREEVGSAVADGLIEAARLGVDRKRRKIEAIEQEIRRARNWSSVDGDEEDEDNSDDEMETIPSSEREQTSASSSGKDECHPLDKGKVDLPCSNKDEASPSSVDGGVSPSSVNGGVSVYCSDKSEASPSPSKDEANPSCPDGTEPHQPHLSSDRIEASPSSSDKEEANPLVSNKENVPVCCSTETNTVLCRIGSDKKTDERDAVKSLDFADYDTSKQLEVLGMEGLKVELQKRGLKCGGTLAERAARLFLLKTVPLEKLDRKLFSNPPGKPALKWA